MWQAAGTKVHARSAQPLSLRFINCHHNADAYRKLQSFKIKGKVIWNKRYSRKCVCVWGGGNNQVDKNQTNNKSETFVVARYLTAWFHFERIIIESYHLLFIYLDLSTRSTHTCTPSSLTPPRYTLLSLFLFTLSLSRGRGGREDMPFFCSHIACKIKLSQVHFLFSRSLTRSMHVHKNTHALTQTRIRNHTRTDDAKLYEVRNTCIQVWSSFGVVWDSWNCCQSALPLIRASGGSGSRLANRKACVATCAFAFMPPSLEATGWHRYLLFLYPHFRFYVPFLKRLIGKVSCFISKLLPWPHLSPFLKKRGVHFATLIGVRTSLINDID